MGVPGMNIVGDPFAMSMQLSDRLHRSAEMQRLLHDRQMQRQADARLAQQQARHDLLGAALRNAGDIAGVVGGDPIADALAQALSLQGAMTECG